ncbi:MAG: carboxypeptidase regulatory-like domain-containing protein [Sandaracinaceae bacterium]|nr:carboxypeptidase regulatory-like domain-containing protein [Sandaracinaceae bacterium]
MSISIERAGLLCAVFALGGVGVWTQCAAPEPAAPGAATERGSPVRGRGRFGASASLGRRDGGAEPTDGGLEPELDERETTCWNVRVVDLQGSSHAALLLVAEEELDEEPLEGGFREELRTDDAGFAVVCTPFSTQLGVDAWTDEGPWGRSSVWVGPNPEDQDPPGDVRVVVFEPVALRGRVLDTDGAPLGGIPIHLAEYDGGDLSDAPSAGDSSLEISGRSDWVSAADGTFEIPLGRLGLWVVWAEDDEHPPSAAGPIAARPGETYDVELRLRRGAHFSATVVQGGAPVPGAFVRMSTRHESRAARTDADGRFDFASLVPEDRVRVTISAPGYVARSWTDLPMGEHTLELERGCELEIGIQLPPLLQTCLGRGPDRQTDSPIDVQVRQANGETGAIWIDDDREPIVLRDLAPGTAVVTIRAFGMSASVDAPLRSDAPNRVTVSLPLDPVQGVLRTTVDRAGLGDPSSEVSLSTQVLGRVYATEYLRGAARGCRVLEAGPHRVDAWLDGGFGDERVVEVRAGVVTDETLRLGVLPPPPPEDVVRLVLREPQSMCSPPITLTYTDQTLLVGGVEPGDHGLLPGDTLVAVGEARGDDLDGMDDERWGPPGTTVWIEARRPDGSVWRGRVARTRCE